jgi:IclR family KDG regulon transcriptional repressor
MWKRLGIGLSVMAWVSGAAGFYLKLRTSNLSEALQSGILVGWIAIGLIVVSFVIGRGYGETRNGHIRDTISSEANASLAHETINKTHGVISKMARILDLFRGDVVVWSLAEIWEKMKRRDPTMLKSSLEEILQEMTEYGFLGTTVKEHYRVGWRIYSSDPILQDMKSVCEEARPILENLRGSTKETVQLATLDGTLVVYLDKIEGLHALRVSITSIGTRKPYAHCSALGKVLLAYKSSDELQEIVNKLGEPLQRFTDNTIQSRDQLLKELQKIRQQGFAFDREEVEDDLCCVSAPIRNYSRQVIAAVSISAPKSRFTRNVDNYRKYVISAASQISTKLGYHSD